MYDNIKFFTFRVDSPSELTWTVPVTTSEGTDAITISSRWSSQSPQGSTESIVAFDHVENPTMSVQLKFHEDLFIQYGYNYKATIKKLNSLVYPVTENGKIRSPYVIIAYNDYVLRGYFSNVKITETGPLRNGYRVAGNFVGSFNIVKKLSAPTAKDIQNNFNTTFGQV